jgi:hypothetical protein
MLRIALKGILGRKARLVLTSLAVILGTAFLSGTAVFSATLNRTFDNLFSDVFRNVDSYVRSTQVIEADFGAEERQRIPAELVAMIEAVPGVGDVQADIQAFARIIGKDGEPLGSDGAGPPTFGGVGEEFQGALWTISEGRFAAGPTEVVLDEAAAKAGKFVLNDKVKVVAQAGSREFTLVGIAGYGVVGKRRRECIDRHPNLRLVAVCDQNFEGSGSFEDGIQFFESYERLLDLDLDALFVCLTNDMASKVTIAGLNKGMHIFCEKPPGRNVNDILRVISTEKKFPSLKLKYGFNHFNFV